MCTRTNHRWFTFLALAGLATATIAFATPAEAANRWSRGGFNVHDSGRVIAGHHGHNHGHSHAHKSVIVHGETCGCDVCFTQREYARGFNRGEAAGANQGFRDGSFGKAFCADIRDDLCRYSKAYRDGYMAAFGKSYRAAFEHGRASRGRTCHTPHRSAWPR